MEGAITALIAGVPVAAVEIEHDPIEIYSNGVRHVKVPDRDGNAITFAEPPGSSP
jgi:hypothetical protein